MALKGLRVANLVAEAATNYDFIVSLTKRVVAHKLEEQDSRKNITLQGQSINRVM